MSLRLLFLTIAIHQVIGNRNSLYQHTKNSILARGLNCFGDCINKTCVYDWYGHQDACLESGVVAPVYKTIKNEDCYSDCGRYNGQSYTWCATRERDSIEWDYCTRHEAKTATKRIQSNNYLYTCKNECSKRDGKDYWCNTHNYWENCDPEHFVLVFNYPTEQEFVRCATGCVLYNGERKCYDEDGNLLKCYLNPDKSAILHEYGKKILKELKYYGELSESGYHVCADRQTKRDADINVEWPFISSVRDLVAVLESEFPSIVPKGGGPVQSYTVMPIANAGADDTIVPLAIRAVITRVHLQRPHRHIHKMVKTNIARLTPYRNRFDGRNDEAEYLLPLALGGAMEPYNFIPEPRFFKRGRGSRWYNLEKFITRFLNEIPGRYVEWQTALSYDVKSARPYRPIAVSLNVRMYEPYGKLNSTSGDLENMHFSNDPLWTRTCGMN